MTEPTARPRKIFALPLILLIMLADQLSKWWVVELLIKPRALSGGQDASGMPFIPWLTQKQALMPYASIPVLPVFNIDMLWNHGVSFGVFNQSPGPLPFIAGSGVIVAAFAVWLARAESRVAAIALSMVIGGALGNVCDRIRFGAVADFLDFHVKSWHYPSFNLADSAICLGIATLVIHGLFFEAKKETKAEPI